MRTAWIGAVLFVALAEVVAVGCSSTSDSVASPSSLSPGSSTTVPVSSTSTTVEAALDPTLVCSLLDAGDLEAAGLTAAPPSPGDPGIDETATDLGPSTSPVRCAWRTTTEPEATVALSVGAAADSSVFEEILADPTADDPEELQGVGERAAYGTNAGVDYVVAYVPGRVFRLSINSGSVTREQMISLATSVAARLAPS